MHNPLRGEGRGEGRATCRANNRPSAPFNPDRYYTHEPIDALTVDLKMSQPVTRAVSTEGREVTIEKTPAGVRLRLPLDWTDIVLLQ
jgi:hypothetical protein